MKKLNYSDLGPVIQKKVVSDFSNINIDNNPNWDTDIFVEWNDKLRDIGFNNTLIYYSTIEMDNETQIYKPLFSFEINTLMNWMLPNKVDGNKSISCIGNKIGNTVHFKHSVKNIDSSDEKEVQQNIELMYSKLVDKIHQSLIDKYNQLTDESAVIETLNNSNMVFTDNGIIYEDGSYDGSDDGSDDVYDLIDRKLMVSIDGEELEYTVFEIDDLGGEYEVILSDDESFVIETDELFFLMDNGNIEFTDNTNDREMEITILV